MKAGTVSFNVRLLAGTTRMDAEKPQAVDRPNGMDGWILNLGIEGSGAIRGGPAPFATKPGDAILFPPETPHLYGHSSEAGLWVHHWLYFFPREHWREWMRWPSTPPGILRVELSGETLVKVRSLFEEAIAFAKSGLPRRQELAMNRLEEMLILCDEAKPGGAESLDSRVEEALRRMEANPAGRHSLASLAKGSSLSPSRFSHLFKEKAGRTPMASLEELRIGRAKELLFISAKSLPEIAEECGFRNQFYFSRVFKKLSGMPPGEFRERLRSQGGKAGA